MKTQAHAGSISPASRTRPAHLKETKLQNRSMRLENRALIQPRRAAIDVRRPSPAPCSAQANQHSERLLELLPQVRFIARRIHRHLPRHVPVEDLYQAGVLGLLDALRKFDPQRRVRFESYMKFRIRGAILDELRSLDWSPRELRRQGRRLEEAHQSLCSQLGREPSAEELAAAARISVRKLESLRNELRGLELSSLQATAVTTDDGTEKDRGSLVACPESIGPQSMFAHKESRERLAEAIESLPESERRVITLYYYEELTMKEVGEVLQVGESRISQIHSRALEHMRSWVLQRAAPKGATLENGAALQDTGMLPPSAA